MSVSATDTFDVSLAWRVSAHVSLRDEAFGALAYHHVTRRLVFLKSPLLVTLVRGLHGFASAHDALNALVPAAQYQRYASALASLASSEILSGC